MGTITSAGVFTPSGAGTATIIATSTQDSTKSGSVTIAVAIPPTITSVSVVCAPASILTTQTSTCTPTVVGTGSYSSIVTWSISPTTAGSISSSGVFAPSGVGMATITATSTQDSTKSGSATVTVAVPPTITSVGIACAPVPLIVTQSTDCFPTVTGTGNYSQAVTWSVSPTTLGTITGAGVFTSTNVGTVQIIGTSAQDSSKFAAMLIAILPPPLSGLSYTVSSLTATVGQEITPDIPTLTGIANSFSISPALPAGLSLNTTTGAISGTPTLASGQATYAVTAVGSSSSTTTANVTITINQAQNTLLELGHAYPVNALQFGGGDLLSMDTSGHWVLWNYASGAQLANSDVVLPSAFYSPFTAVAGQVAVIAETNGLQIRSLADGHLINTITVQGLNTSSDLPIWWQLASDGSYICIGSNQGLFAYDTSGNLTASLTGDFSAARAFAAPGQIQVALGPAGQNVIQTISPVDGSSTISSPFTGNFSSWFLDGSRFLTNVSTTVWVYSNTGVQQTYVSLPSVQFLTGQGNWIWSVGNSTPSGYPLAIYAIGSSTPSFTFNEGVTSLNYPDVFGTTLAIESSNGTEISVIDLSGTTPSETDYNLPFAAGAFAYASPSLWVVEKGQGALVDGTTLTGTPRYFGYGMVSSIAGSSSDVALATARGNILVYDPSIPTLEDTVNFAAGNVALSSDGSVLGASSVSSASPQQLDFYSLPSGNLIQSLAAQSFFSFNLSQSGSTFGEVEQDPTAPSSLRRLVAPVAGGSPIWSDTGTIFPIFLSPDGTLIAEYSGSATGQADGTSLTSIIKNGTVVGAPIPGAAAGWIDNNQLLVNQFTMINVGNSPTRKYSGCTIYDATGAVVSSPPLPELDSFQTATSDSIYDPISNSVYSLTTGLPTWTGTWPTSKIGAVVGSNIVYETGHSVVVEPF
jgi:hypothetical protein